MPRTPDRPLTDAALDAALDDLDRARQVLRHRLSLEPDHPDAAAWRRALADGLGHSDRRGLMDDEAGG